MVRLTLAGAGAGGFFSFCALAGVRKRPADNKAELNDAISSALGLFTEADCAGEGKSCLANAEIDVALIGRGGDRRSAIADITNDTTTLAHRFHVRVPELAH